MMDERRRFQIALGGIATCLLIAALFVSSAPPLSYPVVPHAELGAPAPLTGELPPPVLPESPATLAAPEAARRAHRTALRSRSAADLVTVRDFTPSPPPLESEPLRPRASHVALTGPPSTFATPVDVPVVEPADSDSRGPVGGVFVAAGKEVGRGFRNAGRAIKSIF
jgi:hypothetical protein